MRLITEYLSTKVAQTKIKATDETIKQIVKDELDRLGHDADLNHIDVSEVTNMDSLFSCYDADLGPEYNDLNPDISQWNVSNVHDMRYMFAHCYNFNCDISGWDVSNVINMNCMFFYCEKFNQDISRWDVSKVKHCTNIFEDCPIKEEFKPKFNI
jgi:surface protein